MILCKSCELPITNENKMFCNVDCKHTYYGVVKVRLWLEGKISGVKRGCRLINAVRNYLLEEANYSCSLCGWNKINPHTKKTPLEINHKDGDSNNNKKENLEVICPNCHALTSSWKALNKGNGNKERLRYSGLIK